MADVSTEDGMSPKRGWFIWMKGRRRNLIILGTIISVVMIFQIPVISRPVMDVWRSFFPDKTDSSYVLAEVKRGRFIHEVTVRGDISSSSNVDIKCNVFSASGTMILEVVPEGTHVKKGDLLCLLDSSQLIEQKIAQEITCGNSKASMEQARNDLETAKIQREEYLKGTYELDKQNLESSRIVAEEECRRLEEYLAHSRRLYEKGFQTKIQLDADIFALENAELKLGIAKQEITVLEEYTKKKDLLKYDTDISTAEANYKAKQYAYKMDQEKLDLIDSQIASCRITAPEEGQVVYANSTGGPASTEFVVEEGVKVRERQTILRLPDPQRLQVTADVNEGKINYIKAGMTTTIQLDAMPNIPIHGVVERVNEFPQPTNHWMGNVKEYRVTIKISPMEGIRPGMTANTKILVEHLDNVLTIPTHCIFEHGGKYYALSCKDGNWEKHEVKIGSSNDKVVVVTSGLHEGMSVVCGAFTFRDRVDLPKLKEGHTSTTNLQVHLRGKKMTVGTPGNAPVNVIGGKEDGPPPPPDNGAGGPPPGGPPPGGLFPRGSGDLPPGGPRPGGLFPGGR